MQIKNIEETELTAHEEHKLKKDNKQFKKQTESLLNEIELLNKKIDFLECLNDYAPKIHTIKANKNNNQSEATSFMILSDIHIEERVDKSTTNNQNEYNPDIAKERVSNFFKNGLRLHNIMSKDIQINNIVLALLGDNITGHIHEELMEDNYLSPIQATMLVEDILISGIEYLLKNSKAKIKIVCKIGNHSRTTIKRRIATAYKNSYEYIMYNHIAKHFKDESRLEFIIENGYLTYMQVYDYMIRFHHGDAIGYGGGIGGLTIPTNKAIGNWDKNQKAYLDVFGHHHQLLLDAGKFVCNGSVIGYNPFAIYIKAPFEQPKQAFFLIDKHRGKSVSAPIFL